MSTLGRTAGALIRLGWTHTSALGPAKVWCATSLVLVLRSPAPPFGSLASTWSHTHRTGTFRGALSPKANSIKPLFNPLCRAGLQMAVLHRSLLCCHSVQEHWWAPGVSLLCLQLPLPPRVARCNPGLYGSLSGEGCPFSLPFVRHQLRAALNNIKRRERTISLYSPVNPRSRELRLLGTL